MSIGNFKQQLNDADDVLRVQQERAEKDKRLFELKVMSILFIKIFKTKLI